MVVYIYKLGKRIIRLFWKTGWIIAYLKLKLNKVQFGSGLISNGIPITSISLKSKVVIGERFMMNSGKYHNMIGHQQACYLVTYENAELIIGNNVGISSTAIVSFNKIVIGNNVRIGGGTTIYDSNFHSLNYQDRIPIPEIKDNIKTAPVFINDNVFIGANCTILKGVTIGENSIIGACSVVTKDIPEGCIAAGNPCKVIKRIDHNKSII